MGAFWGWDGGLVGWGDCVGWEGWFWLGFGWRGLLGTGVGWGAGWFLLVGLVLLLLFGLFAAAACSAPP